MTIPSLKCSYLLTTYDGRNNQTQGEGNDITLHGATLSWTVRPDAVDFKLDVQGTKREKRVITEIVDKEIPPETFAPEIPPNIEIPPGGGGTEEIPSMDEYVEKIIEGMDEMTLDKETSMDGMYENTQESYSEDFMDQTEEQGLEDDIIEEGDEEEEQQQEEQQESQHTEEDHQANQDEQSGDQQHEE